MSVRVHGGMTVAYIKREELEEDVALVTGRGPRAVRNQLDRVHGATHLRAAFDEWPPIKEELGALTAAAALGMDVIEDIAGLTDLTPRQVRMRLNRVDHGKTLVRNVFAGEWQDARDDRDDSDSDDDDDDVGEGPVDAGALRLMNVAEARRRHLEGAIADRSGVGLRRVRARLAEAHGNVLVGNLFGDAWSEDEDGADQEGDGEPEDDVGRRTDATRTRVARQQDGARRTQEVVGGRYRLVKLLGRGGQGEAFEATDLQLPQRGRVVIKFASFDTAVREFTIAMKFRHDNICQYFDVAKDSGRNQQYLVIEHGGSSLSRVIERGGALTKAKAFEIIRQAAEALDYAHEKKVIHHDISPGNILIDDDGRVRVTDFGISVTGTMRTVAGGGHTMIAPTLIGRHPWYAAPEMNSRSPVRARADQFSLALVLCSLLEGEVFASPYHIRDFQRLSPRQNGAVRRALRKDAEDRFASCGAFARALQAL